MNSASWIELRADALRHNVAVFRDQLGSARFGAVLKADAYGHGFAQVLPVVHPVVDAIYVIAPEDGIRVRDYETASKSPQRQTIVIGASTPEEVAELTRRDIDVVFADGTWKDAVKALVAARLDRKARVHLHIDTGLGREGFSLKELPALCERIRGALDVIEIAGVLSHFADTEDVTEQQYALAQMDAFERGWQTLRTELNLPESTQRHLAASAAAMVLPPARYDLVRVGIALYGLWPSSQTRLSARVMLASVPSLEPALSWRCRSQVVKRLPAGSFVGYGCTYRCREETLVAVLPVGYFDGYPRALSSRSYVLVGGVRCPVLGRVMMNHVVVDISRVENVGESVEATLIGTSGAEQVTADQLAEWAGTINYEIVARLGTHLRRVVV